LPTPDELTKFLVNSGTQAIFSIHGNWRQRSGYFYRHMAAVLSQMLRA
jgi:hypothetical protein